jgi:hypothetical protein
VALKQLHAQPRLNGIDVTDRNHPKATARAGCDVVTDRKGGAGAPPEKEGEDWSTDL